MPSKWSKGRCLQRESWPPSLVHVGKCITQKMGQAASIARGIFEARRSIQGNFKRIQLRAIARVRCQAQQTRKKIDDQVV